MHARPGGAAAALVMHCDGGRHDTGWGHPEHQGRLPAIIQALERDTPALLEHVQQVEARPAAERAILRVHDAALLERVRAAAAEAERERSLVRLDADTVVSAATWDAALAAAGSALDATSLVARGEARSAFALTRPPGHHATADRAMGFCFFNNVAIAARALQAEHGAGRVLIVDWDVHHGNGTQDIFYTDGSVYFLSLHLAPHYPGTGAAQERGAGTGEGTTRNVPLAHGTPAAAYRAEFEAAVSAAVTEFEPEFILVSAGFDCLAGDPLGGLLLEPGDMHALTCIVAEQAQATAGGRMACVLEGGYVPARVGEGVRAVLRALAGLPFEDSHIRGG
jgi:acetoin utilization deacetylase AcuC-like enzyme